MNEYTILKIFLAIALLIFAYILFKVYKDIKTLPKKK